MVVLLSAISLGRLAFGLLLIAAFSLGLAAVLIAVGLFFVSARHLFTRFTAGQALADRIGVASACVITVFGIVLAVRALADAGLISG
jgi:nickel/cobalt exporter